MIWSKCVLVCFLRGKAQKKFSEMGETIMKRTWRSMLSMVLVASLLLSMVIVSGLSVSAANARVHYITGDDILYSGNDVGCIPADLTTEGNSWTLSLTGNCNTTAGSVVAAVILGEPDMLQDLPYLVIDVDKYSTLFYNLIY